MENFRKLILAKWHEKRMDVIGRNNEFIELIALAVKMSQGTIHQLHDRRLRQNT
ncbi:MAG: hypothetical protein WCI95_12350 [bacterium]